MACAVSDSATSRFGVCFTAVCTISSKFPPSFGARSPAVRLLSWRRSFVGFGYGRCCRSSSMAGRCRRNLSDSMTSSASPSRHSAPARATLNRCSKIGLGIGEIPGSVRQEAFDFNRIFGEPSGDSWFFYILHEFLHDYDVEHRGQKAACPTEMKGCEFRFISSQVLLPNPPTYPSKMNTKTCCLHGLQIVDIANNYLPIFQR